MKARYNIETITFEKDVLYFQGWIFDEEDIQHKNIDNIQIVVTGKSGKEVSCDLKWEERKDVSAAFGLSIHEVGFRFNGSIGVFVEAKVYLQYWSTGVSYRVELLDIKGVLKDIRDEKLFIAYPDVANAYCIGNFEEVKKQYVFKKYKEKWVDIIIPVYNGYVYLEKLFESIKKTTINTRIIVINDCSTDERIDSFFEQFCKDNGNVVYYKNEKNLGFVKSVNKALSMVVNDVALVNTDVEVPDGWLERLMFPIFEDDMVASSTPYTNCGTISSFPYMGQDNRIFADRTLFFVDSVFKYIKPKYTEMPTGVGFCMGMSLKAIKEIGLLDADSFEKGYGEENDWCQRAIKSGYRNVQVENLYVYHKHGGSFQSEEKARLLEENTKKLVAKHANYMADVASYFEYDPNKSYRKYAYFYCLMQINAPTYVFFNHVLGGGANDYLLKKKTEVLAEKKKYIEFAYNAYHNTYEISIAYAEYNLKLYANSLEMALSKVQFSDVHKIYINELVTYPDLYKVLDKIQELKCISGAEMIMLGHDYFCVCPTINLLSEKGDFCKLACTECVGICEIAKNPFSCDTKYDSIDVWHDEWKKFLGVCDSIIVFSEDSKQILEKVYKDLHNIQVIPHITDGMLAINKKYKMSNRINIGILGVLSERKGLSIVKEMLNIIKRENLPVNIVIVGMCEEDIQDEHCIITGKYTRSELPRLMYLYDVDIIFISSVWPETFSYTAEEAMKMKMPIAVFDLGAPAERVKKYDKGLIINEMDAKCALSQICKFTQIFVTDKDIVNKKILFLIEYDSFSSRYRVEHLRENLAIRGMYSCVKDIHELDLGKIKEYDAVSIYRCSEVQIIEKIVKEAKNHNIEVYYDNDDYIFDYAKIKEQEFLKDKEYEDFETYANNIRACMEMCDVLTTSTNTLAKVMAESFPTKKVVVCRNAANLEMQLLSEIAIAHNEKKENKKIVLGYFSGSKTHNNDWKQIESSVVKLLKRNSQVELLICGVLELSTKFNPYISRITRIPFIDWRKLPELIRSIDVNLMPLEDSFFQWCKSENKWTEAGLVGVPTIASANPELCQVLSEDSIVFCRSKEEWDEKLQRLVESKEYRQTIGEMARKKVYEGYLADNMREIFN